MYSNKALLEAVLDMNHLIVGVLDQHGKIVFMSKAYELFTGYSIEEVKGRSGFDFTDFPQIKHRFMQRLEGATFEPYTITVLTKSGAYKQVTIDGRVIGYESSRYIVYCLTPIREAEDPSDPIGSRKKAQPK